MAAPRPGKQYSAALLAQTRQLWEAYYDMPLTEEDAGVIASNLMEFFEVLMKWDRQVKDPDM